jgi:hypothetical protein
VAARQVGLARILLNFWDCSGVYNIKRKEETSGGHIFNAMRLVARGRKEQTPGIAHWVQLVVKLLNTHHSVETSALKKWSQLYAQAAEDDEASKLFGRRSGKKWDGRFSLAGLFATSVEASKKAKEHLHDNIRKLEKAYKDTLGEDWWYEMSALGSNMDLFLYSILMRRHDMSLMLWTRMDVPVRSALLAATWYRKWSQRPDVKPHIYAAMMEYADEFEQSAVDVQLLTMRQDSKMALEALERPSRLWKGQTGVDLAILGNCRKFIETCCVEALDCRWTGDLSPYRQPLGLYTTVALCVDPPPSRTKWTRRVPHPVLIGHAAPLTPY